MAADVFTTTTLYLVHSPNILNKLTNPRHHDIIPCVNAETRKALTLTVVDMWKAESAEIRKAVTCLAYAGRQYVLVDVESKQCITTIFLEEETKKYSKNYFIVRRNPDAEATLTITKMEKV